MQGSTFNMTVPSFTAVPDNQGKLEPGSGAPLGSTPSLTCFGPPIIRTVRRTRGDAIYIMKPTLQQGRTRPQAPAHSRSWVVDMAFLFLDLSSRHRYDPLDLHPHIPSLLNVLIKPGHSLPKCILFGESLPALRQVASDRKAVLDVGEQVDLKGHT